ncbi:MAG: hypothetical protein HQL86_00145 [Magnetococcales bacterium]|nr:hypothetical protein [Magnetococcales bacterium]
MIIVEALTEAFAKTSIQGEPPATIAPETTPKASTQDEPPQEPAPHAPSWGFLPKNEPYCVRVIAICQEAHRLLAQEQSHGLNLRHGNQLSASKIAKELVEQSESWWDQSKLEGEIYTHVKICEWVNTWIKEGKPDPKTAPKNIL